MSDIRNFEEYRRQVLDSLGEDYTVEDLRNEGKWRTRVLDALGVEYDTSDTSYFERYRLKVLEGLQGGGGGGSSDFSTAEVTLINSSERDSYYSISFLSVDSENGCYFEFIRYVTTELTLTVPLYKGKAKISFSIDLITEDEPITTGGVSIDEDYDYIIITGDGTFSAKAISSDN